MSMVPDPARAPTELGPGAADLAVDLDGDAAAGARLAKERERHLILGELGAGAAGMVYQAKDISLRRKVAFKRLHKEVLSNTYVVSHFLTEAQITAQLDHPNIVPVYAMEWDDKGVPSYTMKMIEGKSLRELLKECRSLHKAGLPLDDEHALSRRLEHFLKICDAVSYAHGKGVLHRDLKPENVMIGRWGEVYVMDWGIARLMGPKGSELRPKPTESDVDLLAPTDKEDGGAERTQLGALVGTVHYMSPEQARGDSDALDARSDQYALGVILFELCTIKKAVSGKTLHETLNKVIQAHVEPFVHFDASTHKKLAPELEAIVKKATAADRERRYADVAALCDDVRRYMRGESISALPETRVQRLFRWINRHRELTLLVGSGFLVLVTLLVAGSAIYSLRSQREAAETRRAAAEERRQNLEKARERERKLGQFLTGVTEGRNRLDSHFFRVESLLSALAASAEQLVMRGKPAKLRSYLDTDFADAKKAPPDFAESPHYHRKISTEWPVARLAPGVPPKKVKALLSQLAPLGAEFKDLFVRSSGVDKAPEDARAVQTLVAEKGVPIVWSFVGLEQGLMVAYPGKTGYPKDFDPRKRPWYALGKGKRGLAWGNPYADALGMGLLLPSAMALRGDKGQLLGVAGVECTFDYIIDHLLTLPGMPAVRASYIVDDAGRVVVSTERKGERVAAGKLGGALELKPFPVAEVQQAIKEGGSGYLELPVAGKASLVAYYRLQSLGWYLVVVADPGAL